MFKDRWYFLMLIGFVCVIDTQTVVALGFCLVLVIYNLQSRLLKYNNNSLYDY
jgi:hypothetical protein